MNCTDHTQHLDRRSFLSNIATSAGGIALAQLLAREGLFAAGVDRIELGTPHGVSVAATGIDIIGTQVLPALRRWVG
jgi:hypothetical protein